MYLDPSDREYTRAIGAFLHPMVGRLQELEESIQATVDVRMDKMEERMSVMDTKLEQIVQLLIK